MRLFFALLILLSLAACAPVPGDPYSQRAQADGFIAATQAAQNGRATDAAIIQAAQANEAAAQIAMMQQAIIGTQAAQVAQQTQTALELSVAYATATQQSGQYATATSAAGAISTATQQAQVQATQAAREETEYNMANIAAVVGLFVKVIGASIALFVVRALVPIIQGKASGVAHRIASRSLVWEKNGVVMTFLPTMGESGIYLPIDQALQYMQIIARTGPIIDPPAPRQSPSDADSTSPVYWHVRQLLAASKSAVAKGKLDPGQLASQSIADLGGGQWDAAINALRAAGVDIETVNGVGTFIRDKQYTTADKILAGIFFRDIEILPSPTGDDGRF